MNQSVVHYHSLRAIQPLAPNPAARLLALMPTPPTIDVMLLAAGRGARLRPLTEHIPKPLLKVGQYCLIDYHLYALARASFARVIINVAYLGEQICAHIGNGARYGLAVELIREPPGALGTAGALVNARPYFAHAKVLVINADIHTDYDFARAQQSAHSRAHLVLVPNPPHHLAGDFGYRAGRLLPKQPTAPNFTYAGIGLYATSLFVAPDVSDSDTPPIRGPAGHRHKLGPLLHHLLATERVTAELHRTHWLDVGSPERLQQARAWVQSSAASPRNDARDAHTAP